MKKLNLISALTVILPFVTGLPGMALAQAGTQRGKISKPIDQITLSTPGSIVSHTERHTQSTISYCYNIVTDLKVQLISAKIEHDFYEGGEYKANIFKGYRKQLEKTSVINLWGGE